MPLKLNGFYCLMGYDKQNVCDYCPNNVYSLIEDLHKKFVLTDIKWDGSSVEWEIVNLFKAATTFAMNIKTDEEIDGDVLQIIIRTLKELEAIYNQIVVVKSEKEKDYYAEKVGLINEIFEQNRINDSKALRSYEDLYFVVKLINNKYDEVIALRNQLSGNKTNSSAISVK